MKPSLNVEGICEQSKAVKVKSIKLSDLLDVDVRPDVLKLDCEGCEFDIIEGDYSGVRSFEELGDRMPLKVRKAEGPHKTPVKGF